MSTLHVNSLLAVSLDGITQNAGQFFDGTNAISANPTYSVPLWVKTVDLLCFQISAPATGAPNGSYILQGSNDLSRQEGNSLPDVNLLNWSTLSFWDETTHAFIATNAFAGANSFMHTMQICGPRWVRLKWTNTSGSGLLTVRVQQKSNGGR